jgi:hypothetical protein
MATGDFETAARSGDARRAKELAETSADKT